MTYDDIKKYTASLTDEELIARADMANADLMASEPQSDWHASCFAGLLVYCEEMNRRGLKRPALANGKVCDAGGRAQHDL